MKRFRPVFYWLDTDENIVLTPAGEDVWYIYRTYPSTGATLYWRDGGWVEDSDDKCMFSTPEEAEEAYLGKQDEDERRITV